MTATCVQVRQKEIEDNMERQFKQGMAAPDWEMDDYGWYAPPSTLLFCCAVAISSSSGCQAKHACAYCTVGGDFMQEAHLLPGGEATPAGQGGGAAGQEGAHAAQLHHRPGGPELPQGSPDAAAGCAVHACPGGRHQSRLGGAAG